MFLKNLQNDLNQALKNGEKLKVSVLRLLLSAINYEKIAKQHELSGTEITEVIRKEVKKRREAIELYQQGQREDLANKEKEEAEILNTYLPKQLSEEEVRESVKENVS